MWRERRIGKPAARRESFVFVVGNGSIIGGYFAAEWVRMIILKVEKSFSRWIFG